MSMVTQSTRFHPFAAMHHYKEISLVKDDDQTNETMLRRTRVREYRSGSREAFYESADGKVSVSITESDYRTHCQTTTTPKRFHITFIKLFGWLF